jgi:hypothetical protein
MFGTSHIELYDIRLHLKLCNLHVSSLQNITTFSNNIYKVKIFF